MDSRSQVFAKFPSFDEAEFAARKLVHKYDGEYSIHADFDEEILKNADTFLPLPTVPASYANSMIPYPPTLAEIAPAFAGEMPHHEPIEPMRSSECTLCYSSSEVNVWRASHMLRALGAQNIRVTKFGR